ncbi:hypothetical protein [Oscillatoria sp. FACHB-1406]|nr:hypothetical protein [Oscillatoria sp. FACHB-1406]
MFEKDTSYPVFYWVAVFTESALKRYNRAVSGLVKVLAEVKLQGN